MQDSIIKLREVQSQLEGEEGYDEAAHVNHRIRILVDQCKNYKYQHPVLDQKVHLSSYMWLDL